MIIDTHAHLSFPEFEADLGAVLERARQSGVFKILNVGCDLESSKRAAAMAQEYGGIFATIGLHPYESGSFSESVVEELRGVLAEDDGGRAVKAIGETGLDYYKCEVSREEQIASFEGHLELAREFGLPVVVHNREADEDCLSCLRKFPEVAAVFHCYGSDLAFARRVWELGYYLSFAGVVTYGSAEKLLEVVKEVPSGQFFLETDCPYLAPQIVRGKRNEPANVVEVAKKVAQVREVSYEEVVRMTTENAQRFFNC